MTKWHGGKGSAVRRGADQKKFESNWDAIFGKPKKSPCTKVCKLDDDTGKCIGCNRTLQEITEAGKKG